jgi:hypothetical protein
MSGQERTDDAVRAWIRSGPETASAEFVERTLRPIPRMRQRRSWRIALERLTQPVMAVGGAVALVVVLVAGLGILALRPGGVGGPALPTASPGPSAGGQPTFEMTIGGAGPATGTYRSDLAASVDRCTHATDGSWRYIYVSGRPRLNLDLLIGPEAASPAGSSHVALELEYDPGYFRFDPADMRGGDTAGRSTASIKVAPGPSSTTFTITAVTPDRSDGTDRDPVHVDMTVTCPF